MIFTIRKISKKSTGAVRATDGCISGFWMGRYRSLGIPVINNSHLFFYVSQTTDQPAIEFQINDGNNSQKHITSMQFCLGMAAMAAIIAICRMCCKKKVHTQNRVAHISTIIHHSLSSVKLILHTYKTIYCRSHKSMIHDCKNDLNYILVEVTQYYCKTLGNILLFWLEIKGMYYGILRSERANFSLKQMTF